MRRDPGRRERGGTLPLILLSSLLCLVLTSWSATPPPEDAESLVAQAEGTENPVQRAALGRQALALLTREGVAEGLLLARACHMAGELDRALPLFMAEMERHAAPGMTLLTAFHRFSLDLDRSGRSAACLTAFRAMCRVCPDQVWPLVNLAVGLRHAGRYEEAAKVLEEAAKKDPQGAYLINDRGLVWKAAGRPERAAALYARAISMGGQGAADGATNLGLQLTDQGRLDEAEKVLRPDPQRNTNLLAALMWLRNTLCRGKRPL